MAVCHLMCIEVTYCHISWGKDGSLSLDVYWGHILWHIVTWGKDGSLSLDVYWGHILRHIVTWGKDGRPRGCERSPNHLHQRHGSPPATSSLLISLNLISNPLKSWSDFITLLMSRQFWPVCKPLLPAYVFPVRRETWPSKWIFIRYYNL